MGLRLPFLTSCGDDEDDEDDEDDKDDEDDDDVNEGDEYGPYGVFDTPHNQSTSIPPDRGSHLTCVGATPHTPERMTPKTSRRRSLMRPRCAR